MTQHRQPQPFFYPHAYVSSQPFPPETADSARRRQRRQTAGALFSSVFGVGGRLQPPPPPQQLTNRPLIVVPPRGIGPIDDVLPQDVLCGRGGRINAHPGNVQFRAQVQTRRAAYISKKKLDKAHIAAEIVYEVRGMGGRFLKEDRDGSWWDIGDRLAIKKCGQALREERDDKGSSDERTKGGKKGGDDSSPQQESKTTLTSSDSTVTKEATVALPNTPVPTSQSKLAKPIDMKGVELVSKAVSSTAVNSRAVVTVSGRGAKRVSNIVRTRGREPTISTQDVSTEPQYPVPKIETSSGGSPVQATSFSFAMPVSAPSPPTSQPAFVARPIGALRSMVGNTAKAAKSTVTKGSSVSTAAALVMQQPEEAFGRPFHPAKRLDSQREVSLLSGCSYISDLSRSSNGNMAQSKTAGSVLSASVVPMDLDRQDDGPILPDPTPLREMMQQSTGDAMGGLEGLMPPPRQRKPSSDSTSSSQMDESSSLPSMPGSIVSDLSDTLMALDMGESQ